jgi:hypothetical protein
LRERAPSESDAFAFGFESDFGRSKILENCIEKNFHVSRKRYIKAVSFDGLRMTDVVLASGGDAILR